MSRQRQNKLRFKLIGSWLIISKLSGTYTSTQFAVYLSVIIGLKIPVFSQQENFLLKKPW